MNFKLRMFSVESQIVLSVHIQMYTCTFPGNIRNLNTMIYITVCLCYDVDNRFEMRCATIQKLTHKHCICLIKQYFGF